MNEAIVVISGAVPLAGHVVERIPADADIIAVDGGLDHALAAGLLPRRLVGDLDSVTDDSLMWAARNAEIVRYPTDKDQTDTELALALAAMSDPASITLIGGGDRLDHTVAGIGALGMIVLTGVPVLDAWWDGQHVRVLHGPGTATLDVEPASTLSIVAMHGACRHVTVRGTRWELDRFDLEPLAGTGVSNVAEGGAVEITVAGGVLTVFDVPAAPATPDDTAHPTPHSTPEEPS